MRETEPSASDGQSEPDPPRNGGGSLSRLRTLLRLIRRPRGPRGSRETMDALIAAAALEDLTPITPQERFLIGNILKVHGRNAADVMVPRVDIVALDVEQPTLIERPDGCIIADARLPIETLEEHHGGPLRAVGDEEAVDTLGGLVFTLAGWVPKRGEVITHPDGIEFEVLDADPRRVKRLRVRGLPASNGGKGVVSA